MSDKANINPSVLKWARESAKLTLETAAKHLTVDKNKIDDWEKGISKPTIKQAEKLAKFYKRPFAVFFLSKIPADFHTLKDFRKENSKPLSTATIFILREIQQKQSWLRDISIESGESKLKFIGKYSMNNSPSDVAEDILNTLQINPAFYESDNILKKWIANAERKGICISRTSFIHSHLTLDSKEFQGFSIADNYAPFVFINSDDWNAPQLFTLVHELAHLWIAESGISNEIEPAIDIIDKLNPVELFCNQVAANALLPQSLMLEIDFNAFKSTKEIFNIAKKFGISSSALLVRALQMKIIDLKIYKKMRELVDTEFRSFEKREEEKKRNLKEKETSSGPNYYLLQINKNSKLFTQIVLDSYRNGVIQAIEASNLLNTKINHFQKLEAQIYK
jgi:Zn-dependent peptidase ImmA (M78 family)/DNA-binding XRE family transcriptional regulator